jgi:hypothetical protein
MSPHVIDMSKMSIHAKIKIMFSHEDFIWRKNEFTQRVMN